MARSVSNFEARITFRQRLLVGLAFKPIHVVCCGCQQATASDMEWICGYDRHQNLETKRYSFLHKCKRCGRAPKSFECPLCSALNFLDDDKNGSFPARKISTSPRVEVVEISLPPKKDPLADSQNAHVARRTEIEREIELAQLQIRLAELKASPLLKAEKNIQEKMRERFYELHSQNMGLHAIAREIKSQNAFHYADDPEAREMADASVDAILEKEAL